MRYLIVTLFIENRDVAFASTQRHGSRNATLRLERQEDKLFLGRKFLAPKGNCKFLYPESDFSLSRPIYTASPIISTYFVKPWKSKVLSLMFSKVYSSLSDIMPSMAFRICSRRPLSLIFSLIDQQFVAFHGFFGKREKPIRLHHVNLALEQVFQAYHHACHPHQ